MMLEDQHGSDDPYYECFDCSERYATGVNSRYCSECGGYLRNIAVSRQE